MKQSTLEIPIEIQLKQFLTHNPAIVLVQNEEEAKFFALATSELNDDYSEKEIIALMSSPLLAGRILALRFDGKGNMCWGDAKFYKEEQDFKDIPQYTIEQLKKLVLGINFAEEMEGVTMITHSENLVEHIRNYLATISDIIIVCKTVKQLKLLNEVINRKHSETGLVFSTLNKNREVAFRFKKSQYYSWDTVNCYREHYNHIPILTFNELVRESGFKQPKTAPKWFKPQMARALRNNTSFVVKTHSAEDFCNLMLIIKTTWGEDFELQEVCKELREEWLDNATNNPQYIKLDSSGIPFFIDKVYAYEMLDVQIPQYRPNNRKTFKNKKQTLSSKKYVAPIVGTDDIPQCDTAYCDNFDEVWEILSEFPTETFIVYQLNMDKFLLRHKTMRNFGKKQYIFHPQALSFTSPRVLEVLEDEKFYLPQASLVLYTDNDVFQIIPVETPKYVSLSMLYPKEEWVFGKEKDGKKMIKAWLNL